jgi:hypothetical protein
MQKIVRLTTSGAAGLVLAFAEIRGRRLGHPSSNQTSVDFGIEPEEAEELALAFYGADVRSRVVDSSR